jgi:DNA-binding response OmpR family regulator
VRPLLVYAPNVPTPLVELLTARRTEWRAMCNLDAVRAAGPSASWSGALVMGEDVEDAITFCREVRRGDDPIQSLLLALPADQLTRIRVADDLFDDFVLLPFQAPELEIRLDHLAWRATGNSSPDIIEYAELQLNISTYQAGVRGRPLDLTYMEYELLRHFVTHPGRVLTREELLRNVWGYEYYGGARTVDVHVRRLRAKLGDEDAHLIQTVRSVGYLFGRPI